MYVTVNDTRLFFDVAGPGLRPHEGVLAEVPTLLILHGGPGSDHSAVKGPLLPLAEEFQLVWIDHRGNGRSAQSDPSHWNLAQWADDVRAFCDALGIAKPIVLGQSFGGVVAQAYATRYPEHPGKLILSSICAKWDYAMTIARFAARGGAEVERVAANFWGRMNPEDITEYRSVCLPVYASRGNIEDARAMALNKEDVMRHFLAPGGEFQTMDLRASLASITCPTLVLAGEDDPVIPWELSREMADALVNAPLRFECLTGCGHGVWRDEPQRARDVLRGFIASPLALLTAKDKAA